VVGVLAARVRGDELDGSLGRLRFDYIDLIYYTTLPAELSVEQAVTRSRPCWRLAIEAATLAAAAQGIRAARRGPDGV